MWIQLLLVVVTALLSSLLTLGLGYYIFERYLKDDLLRHIDEHVDEAIEELGREIEIRVKQGVVDGVASIPSSEVIAGAALSRENSRGAHYREDFTDVGSLEDSYFTVARRVAGQLDVAREPVVFSIVKPGETLLDEEPAND